MRLANPKSITISDANTSVNWGTILSRSWLASRALDHLLSPAVDFIDKTRVTISGHSRNGKQAMLAGAFDERVTAVVSSSSGSPVRARTLDLLDLSLACAALA